MQKLFAFRLGRYFGTRVVTWAPIWRLQAGASKSRNNRRIAKLYERGSQTGLLEELKKISYESQMRVRFPLPAPSGFQT
jgi:hypothetical protein